MSSRPKLAFGVLVVAAAIALTSWTCARRSPDPPRRATPARRADGDRFIAQATQPEMTSATLRLGGHVVDDHDHPIASAAVRLFPGAVETTSDADGSFGFDLAPGRYYVYADAGDLYSHRTAVQLDATTEPLVVRMIRGATIVVHVTGDGRPLAAAEVRLEGVDPTTTDEAGVARFPGRWPGSFDVHAVAPGYAEGYGHGEVDGDPGGVVDVAIALERGAPVSGTVVDDTGRPVAGAVLDVERLSDGGAVHAISDATGAWRVDAVARGRYHISAKSDRYGPVPAPALDLDGATPRTGIVVHVAAGGTVVGTVTDVTGPPVAGVAIDLQQDSRVDQFDGTSDAHGHYEIHGLPAGTYTVMRRIGRVRPRVASVTVSDRQRVELPIVIDDDHIDGVVVDATGAPVAGAWVADHWAWSVDVTDARGHFELVLRKGDPHELIARRAPIDPRSSEQLHQQPSAHVEGSARDVRLVISDDGSELHDLGGIAPKRAAPGDVPAAAGTDVGGIDGVVDGFRGDITYLNARRHDGATIVQARVDRAGEFHFDGLPAGTYEITEDELLGPARIRAFTVTVEPNRRVRARAVIAP